ncbi:hypothetical protein Ahu01nite_081430 [Winogradskya humida]|uniref:Integrase-like protein n=1 Tax=Winogradskya humida TaxID=113566 RepID=A0ABQ4A2F3_9ACTN|nr:hypothetical protein Ahu01nite_081430 [Actinoplanes humidus]
MNADSFNLATVIDLHSRRLAGWAIAGNMPTDLIIDALTAARRTCGSLDGAIFHSDHNEKPCKAGARSPTNAKPGSPVCAGYTATTPSAATPGPDNDH